MSHGRGHILDRRVSKGGEYLFAPGITALVTLADGTESGLY
jgi:hypothetical protein